tara:strand:- start:2518 stop:2922 length:405 start_codon:yes stop_codon:yes gene_type:complete
MPHKIIKGKGPLAGHSQTKKFIKGAGETLKKTGLKIQKAWRSDSNPVQAVQNRKITQNIKKGNSAGRIQKTLTEAGHSKTGLRLQGEKNKKFQDNRKYMDNLRKTNPEKYKKLKKEERRKANIASMKAGSHTWD